MNGIYLIFGLIFFGIAAYSYFEAQKKGGMVAIGAGFVGLIWIYVGLTG
jgi:hypothetical protein